MTSAWIEPERRLSPVEGVPDLFRFRDCCCVYALRSGDRAVLIDLGSGAVLDRLPEVGISSVDAVLFTHAHRDQCQGMEWALQAGVPLLFPSMARSFVERGLRPDLTPPSPLVRRYPGCFEPPRPVERELSFDLQPGRRIPIGGAELEIVPAPGHIDHQVACLVDWRGVRLCFCGDAYHSPGRLHEAYHWETDHYTGAGLRAGIETLRLLRLERPDLLLPSHGPITRSDTWSALAHTEAAMRRLAELKDTIVPGRPAVRRLVAPRAGVLQRLSEHLYVWNNSYFLVSGEGPVLMVDSAGPLPEAFRKQFREEIGDRPIEAILITHIHSDHVEGIEPLRREGWTGEVWAHELLAGPLADPHALRRPWLPASPVPVDRVLAEGAAFRFHEYALTAFAAPGQTDLHACYALEVDGRRAILSGDNFYPAQQWGGTGGLCGLNGGHPDLWRRTIDLYLRLEPEWVLASHTHPFEFRREDFLAMRAWCDDVAAAMRDLSPDGCLERHHVPDTFALRPYARTARPGSELRLRAVVQNPYRRAVPFSCRLVLPPGWRASPEAHSGEIAPEGDREIEWLLLAPDAEGAFMLTAELCYDGDYLGEKIECFVHLAR